MDPKKFIDSYQMFSSLLEIELLDTFAPDFKNFAVVLQGVALKVFFDSFFVHNLKVVLRPEAIQQDEGDDSSPNLSYDELVELMTKMMFSKEQTLSQIAIHGFCKLLMHGRLEETSEILSFMVLFWHSKKPKSEDTVPSSVVQYLSAFFNVYSNSRHEDAENLEEAFEGVFYAIILMLTQGYRFDSQYLDLNIEKLDVLVQLVKAQIVYMKHDRNEMLKEYYAKEDPTGTATLTKVSP